MPQDAFTLRSVANSLDQTLSGAKVNKINQPVLDEIVIHLYNKGEVFKLLISANAIGARISLTKEEKPNPLTAHGFCMLLRKYLISAQVLSVSLVDFERIVRVKFTALNDFLESREISLYAEIMGKYSNIVLTEGDKILGSMKAFNLDISSLRPLTAGMSYKLPPKQDKFYYNEVGLIEKLKDVLDEKKSLISDEFSEFIFNNVIGFSKPTAIEVAYNFIEKHGEISAQNYQELPNFLESFWLDDKGQACIKISTEGKPLDFYPFDYKTATGSTDFYADILTAQETFYDKKENARVLLDSKRKLLSIIKKQEDKLKKREEIIAKKERDCRDMEKDKINGELIISNLYRILEGDKFAVVENFYDDMKVVKIPLDVNLSPSKNAETYFKRYNKKKRTLSALIPQKEELQKEKEYVLSLKAQCEIADSLLDYAIIEEELKKNGFIKGVKEKNKKQQKTKFTTYDFNGYKIKVGKNNLQNDELTFSSAPQSAWLHVKDYHSSHVVIEYDGRPFSDEVILVACEICAYYSEVRGGEKVSVDYTLKKHVKKPSRSNPGFVNYSGHKTLVVKPVKHEELLKKQ